MCQVLENRNKPIVDRMDHLTDQLKELRTWAEDSDTKSEEVGNRCAGCNRPFLDVAPCVEY